MRFSDLSLRTKIALAILIAGSCVAAAAMLTHRSLVQLEADAALSDHTYDVLLELRSLEILLIDIETGQRGFLLTGDPQYLEPYERASKIIDGHVENLRQLISDNPAERTNLDRLRRLVNDRIAALNGTLEVYRQRGLPAAIARIKTNQGRLLMEKARGVIGDMDREELRLLSVRRAKEKAGRDRNNFLIIAGVGGTFTFLAFISLLIRNDLVLRRRLRETIEHLALQDALTGLPNRAAFDAELRSTIARSTRVPRRFALLYFDLDGFKTINDRFGHHAGDEVLRKIGERVQRSLRANDHLARLGGDEFVVLLDEIASHADAGTAAQKIIDAVSRPIALGDGQEGRVSASIGISIFPDHEVRPEYLIRFADQAMYQAKEAGKARFRFYTRPA